jgi:hypothetical protein
MSAIVKRFTHCMYVCTGTVMEFIFTEYGDITFMRYPPLRMSMGVVL